MALTHITLATRDVRRSSEFFEAALGWRPVQRPGNIDRPAAWLAIAPGVGTQGGSPMLRLCPRFLQRTPMRPRS